MRKQKSAYELSNSQVDTPHDVVATFWSVVHLYRRWFSSVLDLGAGDGRFALDGRFRRYVGVEIDEKRIPKCSLPANCTVEYKCAFQHKEGDFSACIGNPPYARHHDLDPKWRTRTAADLGAIAGIELNLKCNLYIYFLLLSLLKTKHDGLVASIVPFEWVSRPASAPLRDYIVENRWRVDTYRFCEPIFDSVQTTAAISVIDKRELSGDWRYFEIDRIGTIRSILQPTGSLYRVIPYSSRGDTWAMRGMSPGTQKVFTLTEGERIHHNLSKADVYPCLTSLREIPLELKNLTWRSFQKRYVDSGLKCWLIRTDRCRLSTRLREYISCIPKEKRNTRTCKQRVHWYRFRLSPPPELFVSSGFTGKAPKVLINSIGAYAVGGVHGIHNVRRGLVRKVQKYIQRRDCSLRVVSHSGNLRKLEVYQLNTLLNGFVGYVRRSRGGKK